MVTIESIVPTFPLLQVILLVMAIFTREARTLARKYSPNATLASRVSRHPETA